MTDDQNLTQTSAISSQSSDGDTNEPAKQEEIAEPQVEEVVDEVVDSSLDNSLNREETAENVILGNEVTPESEVKSQDAGQASMTDSSEPETSDEQPVDEKLENEPTTEEAEPVSNDNPNARWYVVHTYSGHENKVATTLKQKVETERLEEKILDVLVPVQDKIEIKNGKKSTIKEKIFPGYILVKMVLDDDSWVAVRTTQGVTSFVGIGNKPTPISEKEVQTIVAFTKTTEPVYKQVFMANDTVKIVEGPFAEFIGKVDSVDEERGKVKVLVSIFGRETPVELDFLQVQKI